MKLTILSLLAAASLCTSQELPTCESGVLKCCRDVVQYSDLPEYVQEYYGIDPELNNANACSDGEFYLGFQYYLILQSRRPACNAFH